MSHDQEWFYLNGQERKGPFDLATIQQLLQAGVIHPETRVAKQGDPDWKPAAVALFLSDHVAAGTAGHTATGAKTSATSVDWRMKVCIGVLLVIALAMIVVRSQVPRNHPLDTEDAKTAEMLIQPMKTSEKKRDWTYGLSATWLNARDLERIVRQATADFYSGKMVSMPPSPSAYTNVDASGELDRHLYSLCSSYMPPKHPDRESIADSHGRPFQVALDGDGDGKVPLGKKSARARAVVWSTGPNGINEYGKGDDEMRVWK